jgi:two-component system sensor histidine kinase YesM
MLAVESWTPMLVAVCGLVLALSGVVILTMDRTISRPVARISKKAKAIANGDFSPDPGIESDSEIGQVGRSINQLSRDVAELMEKRLADEQNKRELEYRMLQGQINPHFLYNTLGSIKWMATLQKASGIAEMTTALTRLLRTLAKDLRKVVPLRDEIALLDDYYTILKYRYGGTIEYDKQIEEEALLESMLPRFVLQPLMENAIFHGIEPKGKGQLELRVERQGESVLISIMDDGVGLSREGLARVGNLSKPDDIHEGMAKNGLSSLGLQNVHQRIQNVFGPAYGLTVESEKDSFTRVTICVPYAPNRVLEHAGRGNAHV